MDNFQPWILYNGQWKRNGEILATNNRSFLYGDGLFETIRIVDTRAPFLSLHVERLLKSMSLLGFEENEDLTELRLSKFIEQLLTKNRWYKGARVRFTVFRMAEGKYTPENQQTGYILTGEPLVSDPVFPFKGKGRIMDSYSSLLKSNNLLSITKTTSSIIYVLAGLYANQNSFDDVFLKNQNEEIIETVNSNVILIKKRELIAPGPEQFALDGTMRKTVLKIGREMGFKIIERGLIESDVFEADEIMLTNAIQGINWVKGYKDRRYYSNIGFEFSKKLNEIVSF
jgi:branched-subunit amino acid aminotransferase/4-amino-4-deoxychorismate lyase